MKKWILALSVAGGVLALSACNQGNSENVAESKAGNITQEELYNSMKEKVGDQALQQLVLEKVLSDKYKVTDKELDDKIAEIKEQLGENFNMFLANNGLKDEKDLKKALKLSMLQEKAAVKDIKVTDKELKEYYDNYKPSIKVRHILVADEAAANEVKKKLDGGAKFEDVAKESSTDTATAQNGGDLGTINNANAQGYDQAFIDAAYALKVNEISAPVKSQFGYHIIQVTERQEKKSFDDMKKQLEYELKTSKITQEDFNKALQRELKDADVKVTDKDLKGALDIQTSNQ